MAFLALDNLTKSFGSHVAVDRLTLGVEKGEFVSLLGPSGCGKTTTLQMIAGFQPPTSGSIALEGNDLTAVKPAQRGLGIVFQSYALFPHMFPLLARLNVVRTWSGIRVMTHDGFPIYDQSETCPGAFLVCCHSGVTLAANHAFTLASMINKGRLDADSVGAFSARRFDVH